MRKSRFSVEQITYGLKQVETGIPGSELRRKLRISEQAFYASKKKYGGVAAVEARRVSQLRPGHSIEHRPIGGLTSRTVLRAVGQKDDIGLPDSTGGPASHFLRALTRRDRVGVWPTADAGIWVDAGAAAWGIDDASIVDRPAASSCGSGGAATGSSNTTTSRRTTVAARCSPTNTPTPSSSRPATATAASPETTSGSGRRPGGSATGRTRSSPAATTIGGWR